MNINNFNSIFMANFLKFNHLNLLFYIGPATRPWASSFGIAYLIIFFDISFLNFKYLKDILVNVKTNQFYDSNY